ncbi:hypothetical protein [Streptomyces sp. DSM 40750]|uniref:hypothetical protein n=1 Tax=Streptomyces sp. DSM 40750 TaxID=2801030 RepID=UPI00214C211F|nr:hypothetical protein [Streptomyces sp. DSM 40750]UUU25898.1 hypothetical protein JIX55_39860 [Streptomyces sp. DSM 40750]
MKEITAYLNDDVRLDDVAIEQAEGTVLVELGGPVLATPAVVVATVTATRAVGLFG